MSSDSKQMSAQELRAWASQYKSKDLLELSHRAKEEDLLPPADRQFLYSIGQRLKSQNLTVNQLRRLKRTIDKLDTPDDEDIPPEVVTTPRTSHLTVRMAWHDSGWNGRICRNPTENIYCVGQFSLLSRRIRERRDTELESQNAGSRLDDSSLGEYIPPCFWSINANSDQEYTIRHDNPAAPNFPDIEEELPDHSVFTWPFKLSFVRDQDKGAKYGRYFPEKLFQGRIDRFRNGIEDYESIAFLYTNYDNPISGDLQQYLIVGAALVSDQGDPRYFEPSQDQLDSIRKRKGSQNFPVLNWALRYSLDLQSDGFLLPYEPYLRDGLEIDPQYQDELDEVKVVVSEPELIPSFKYVSMPVGDDTAIMLLAKIRKSLLLMIEQAVVDETVARNRLAICQELMRAALERRTHFPGFANLVQAVLGLRGAEYPELDRLVTELQVEFDSEYGDVLVDLIGGTGPETWPLKAELADIIEAVGQKIGELSVTPEAFVRISMLNLTADQFSRIQKDPDLPSLPLVAQNPYLLAEEYPEDTLVEDERLGHEVDAPIGMHNIDIAFHPAIGMVQRLPRFQDIPSTDPRRIRPLILDVLKNQESFGHCYLESRRIERALRGYPLSFGGTAEDLLPTGLRNMEESFASHLHEKIRWHDDGDYRFFYLLEIMEAEKMLRAVVDHYVGLSDFDLHATSLQEHIDSSLKQLIKAHGGTFDSTEFANERTRLYSNVLNRRLSVITGGPGTGKSYEILRIFRFFRDLGENVILLAPTGKAAQRLAVDETFGKTNAKTIDKFLNENREQDTFTASKLNVMVDECSMVDLVKMHDLMKKLDAINGKPKRIILIGDRFQLPPIGYGKPFFDIIDHLIDSKLGEKHLASLSVNCRQGDDGSIARAAEVFGQDPKHYEPMLQSLIDGEDKGSVTVDYWADKDDLYEKIDSRIAEVFDIARSDLEADPSAALDTVLQMDTGSPGRPTFNVDAFQIISPYRTAFSGTSGINYRFQTKYRATKEVAGQTGDVFFRLNDKLVITKNTYRKGQLILPNGAIGVLSKKGELSIGSGDTFRLNEVATENVELAYGLTVHKAQGSGFDRVFVVIPERHALLSRELLYTALSRAKKSLHLFIEGQQRDNNSEHLLNTIRTTSHVLRRNTSLFKLPLVGYSYIPENDIRVKSRVEYIIYRKLEEFRRLRGGFNFEYERSYSTPFPYNLHPDFCIELSDGTVYYWEHLGRTKDKRYVRNWHERKQIYEEQGDLSRIVTTDEESGIVDQKIERIIEAILSGDVGSEFPDSSYSSHHFSLA